MRFILVKRFNTNKISYRVILCRMDKEKYVCVYIFIFSIALDNYVVTFMLMHLNYRVCLFMIHIYCVKFVKFV